MRSSDSRNERKRKRKQKVVRKRAERYFSALLAAVLLTNVVVGDFPFGSTKAADRVLTCNIPEHTHGDGCYTEVAPEAEAPTEGATEPRTPGQTETQGESDTESEKETDEQPIDEKENESIWKKTFANVTVTGNWANDMVAIAKTQVGYKESTRDFVKKDGKKNGYMRRKPNWKQKFRRWLLS